MTSLAKKEKTEACRNQVLTSVLSKQEIRYGVFFCGRVQRSKKLCLFFTSECDTKEEKKGGSNMKIVIVEDDQRVREELQQFLQNYGYEVAVIEQFQDVVGQLMQLAPQLILLDVNLPTHDGYTICREWRKQSEVPIIIVTSRSSDVDELMSMHLGADDFITKPFNTQILMARIEAILKRTYQQGNSQVLTYHDLQLDVAKGVLSYQNEHVTLTKNELIIFQYLVQNQGTIVARESLMEYLWSTSAFIDDNTLSVNVTRLRKKIEGLGVTNPIETRRGLGYLLP